jgi:hypothetical protein
MFAYEGASVRAWLMLAKRARTIVDVGANTGLFSLTAIVNPNAAIRVRAHSLNLSTQSGTMLNNARIIIHRSALSNEPPWPMFMPQNSQTIHIPPP